MGAPECGGRDMPQAASTAPTGAQSGLGGSPLRAAGGQPYRDFAGPSKLGTPDRARPRPVSCSRFRRQIQTPRGAWIWHLGPPAEAGEPFYLGTVSRPFKLALLDHDLGAGLFDLLLDRLGV